MEHTRKQIIEELQGLPFNTAARHIIKWHAHAYWLMEDDSVPEALAFVDNINRIRTASEKLADHLIHDAIMEMEEDGLLWMANELNIPIPEWNVV